MNKLNESESIPRKFGIDIPLFPSEIHTLQVIGDHPESNVRTVAGFLGITPGAASQTITKLSKRDLVTKVRGLKNEKEVHLALTPLGRTAYEAHETVHEMLFQKICERIGTLSSDEYRFLDRILHTVESVYDERIEVVRTDIANEKSRSREDES